MSQTRHPNAFQLFGALLRRRALLIVGVIAVAVAIAVAYSSVQDARYRSTAQVLLSRVSVAPLVTQTPSPALSESAFEQVVDTEAAVARTPQVAEAVTRRVPAPGLTADKLLDDSSVAVKGGVDILEFSVVEGDPVLARRLATEYARQYQRFRRGADTAALVRSRRGLQRQLLELRRQGRGRSPAYVELFTQLRQLQSLDTAGPAEVTVLRSGSSPTKVEPNLPRAVLAALALGVILALALALLRDATDSRVSSAAEMADLIGLPVLGLLPRPRRSLRRRKRLTVIADRHSRDAELYRLVRAGMDSATSRVHAKVIMLTAGKSGQGTSTTAANLASAMALQGTRVLVVDLDLVNPTLHSLLGVDRVPGAVDVLTGSTILGEAIRPVDLTPPGAETRRRSPLYLLPAGEPDPEAADAAGFPDLLADLKASPDYDLVIIDSPPLPTAGYVRAAAGQVDGLVVVARLNSTRRDEAANLAQVLDGVPRPKLGLLITDARAADLGLSVRATST